MKRVVGTHVGTEVGHRLVRESPQVSVAEFREHPGVPLPVVGSAICRFRNYGISMSACNGELLAVVDAGAAVAIQRYRSAMRTIIDKAGRLVIPATIRDRAGLTPGETIEISLDEGGVRIERVVSGPRLMRVGRRLVARPTCRSTGGPP